MARADRDRFVGFALALAGSVLVAGAAGCSHSRIVTHDPAFKTEFEVGRIYALKHETLVARLESGPLFGARYWLSVPEANRAREAARQLPGAPRPDQIVGTVPAGTRVRFEFLGLFDFIESWQVHPYGTILDGAFAGSLVQLPKTTGLPARTILRDPITLEPVP